MRHRHRLLRAFAAPAVAIAGVGFIIAGDETLGLIVFLLGVAGIIGGEYLAYRKALGVYRRSW